MLQLTMYKNILYSRILIVVRAPSFNLIHDVTKPSCHPVNRSSMTVGSKTPTSSPALSGQTSEASERQGQIIFDRRDDGDKWEWETNAAVIEQTGSFPQERTSTAKTFAANE